MNKLVEQMEKDQTEVIDKTSNIKSLAEEVKKIKNDGRSNQTSRGSSQN